MLVVSVSMPFAVSCDDDMMSVQADRVEYDVGVQI